MEGHMIKSYTWAGLLYIEGLRYRLYNKKYTQKKKLWYIYWKADKKKHMKDK